MLWLLAAAAVLGLAWRLRRSALARAAVGLAAGVGRIDTIPGVSPAPAA